MTPMTMATAMTALCVKTHCLSWLTPDENYKKRSYCATRSLAERSPWLATRDLLAGGGVLEAGAERFTKRSIDSRYNRGAKQWCTGSSDVISWIPHTIGHFETILDIMRQLTNAWLDILKQFWTFWNNSATYIWRFWGSFGKLFISFYATFVRFSAEIAKKCDLVQKLLKSAI